MKHKKRYYSTSVHREGGCACLALRRCHASRIRVFVSSERLRPVVFARAFSTMARSRVLPFGLPNASPYFCCSVAGISTRVARNFSFVASLWCLPFMPYVGGFPTREKDSLCRVSSVCGLLGRFLADSLCLHRVSGVGFRPSVLPAIRQRLYSGERVSI